MANLLQAYANLELPKGSALEEVEKQYKQLASKFAPDKHGKDPARVELAKQLSDRLRGAYERLVQYLTPRT